MVETLVQELLRDLRATQAKLEVAQEDAASLRVLLALRTHQHDLAWQARHRLEVELATVLAQEAVRSSARVDTPTDTVPADKPTGDEAPEALACAEERFAAAQTVLGALLDSIRRRALDRRRFQELIARAGREAPDTGPGAARHAVLLSEARRVLGIAG